MIRLLLIVVFFPIYIAGKLFGLVLSAIAAILRGIGFIDLFK